MPGSAIMAPGVGTAAETSHRDTLRRCTYEVHANFSAAVERVEAPNSTATKAELCADDRPVFGDDVVVITRHCRDVTPTVTRITASTGPQQRDARRTLMATYRMQE
jgi:hypothetical protein